MSCKGLLRLEEELRGLRIVSAAPSALAEAAREAQRKGWDAILCLSPLVPEQAEALLLPEAGLAATFIAVGALCCALVLRRRALAEPTYPHAV